MRTSTHYQVDPAPAPVWNTTLGGCPHTNSLPARAASMLMLTKTNVTMGVRKRYSDHNMLDMIS